MNIHELLLMKDGSRFKKSPDHVRDMVLGMNDGFIEILSRLTGAYGSLFYVALGGLIAAIAEALSMEMSFPPRGLRDRSMNPSWGE